MTLEEAQQLNPGDIISGAHSSRRVLTKVWIENHELCWNQEGNGDTKHSYEYKHMTLVERAKPVVNNSYPIY